MNVKKINTLVFGAISFIFTLQSFAADSVKIGYQTGIEPSKVALADGIFEKDSGRKIEWRRFDNGSEVIRAIASGDIDVGNVGSTIVATAGSRQLPVQTFLIAAELGSSEALVIRNNAGINSPADLVGKTIAVPFVSTSHYSLLAALKHWGIDRTKVKVINLRGSEIPAAWKRGDIDAAYAWEPALGVLKETGNVLATSGDVASWGSPSYDVWITRKDFATKNPEFLLSFTKTSLTYFKTYQDNPKAFATNPEILQKISRVTGAKTADISILLSGNNYPLADQQKSLLDNTYVKAISDTAAFLKEQGKLDSVAADYRSYSTSQFIQK